MHFQSLSQNHNLFKRGKHCWTIKFTVPEVKILLLLSYMLVFGIVLLLNYVFLSNVLEKAVHTEPRYFLCHLLGDDSTCEADSFQKQKNSHERAVYFCLRILLSLVIALYSLVQLLLTIQFQDAKRAAKWITGSCTDTISINTNTDKIQSHNYRHCS